MSRADEVRALANDMDHRDVGWRGMLIEDWHKAATALRDYAELIEAAEELLAARDAPPRADIEGAMAAGKAYDAAWERLRRAVER